LSCSSIKKRFDELKSHGGIVFAEAVSLYNDLKGSLDAHKMELEELRQNGNQAQIQHLKSHIHDGEQMLSELHGMTLR